MPRNRFYCSACIIGMKPKKAKNLGFRCESCNGELRVSRSGVVARLLSGLKTKRGLRRPRGIRSHTQYERYLQSPFWRQIRKRILSRDNKTCAICRKEANVVHHKSYSKEVMDGINDSELISLCTGCHERIEFNIVDGNKKKNSLTEANEKLRQFLL